MDSLLYAGNSFPRKHRPRIRLTIRQRTRVLQQWPAGCTRFLKDDHIVRLERRTGLLSPVYSTSRGKKICHDNLLMLIGHFGLHVDIVASCWRLLLNALQKTDRPKHHQIQRPWTVR
jgi:hypothetical protein